MAAALSAIRCIVVDVDGTLTDGGIYYDNAGNEFKKFCTRDGAGFLAARQVGIKLMALTGRECYAVQRRMEEFQFAVVEQNVRNKTKRLAELMREHGLCREDMAFIGDDLNDIGAMRQCGFVGCPLDACIEVRQIAHYISPYKGGYGAARDVIAFLLRARGQWADAVKRGYNLNP
ncbi:MAG: HAD-IIIA family hydrolase [Desulfovibrio sp.]|jgi:3-deoxy-D-manno-octulosonate 8-phosphate phosphatase (KDO 8-P phosphatase)|nr:HAD-IIIA family hydrolase [Desulfovibrio sp.]